MSAHTELVRNHYRVMFLGLILGATIMIAGIVLTILGANGSFDIFIASGSLSAKMTNAAPGVGIALMGLIIVIFFRPRVRRSSSVLRHESGTIERREHTRAGARLATQR